MLDDNTTVAEYAAEWTPVVTNSLAQPSKDGYAYAINNYVCPLFQNTKLKDFKALHVEKILASISHLSKATQSKIFRIFKSMMYSACENGLMIKNPCDNKRASGKNAIAKTTLTKEQQTSLLSAVEGTRAHVFVAIGFIFRIAA